MENKNIIGKTFTVTIDRQMGTSHPKYPQNIYPINYGYVEGIKAPDGDFQDVYVLGVGTPLETFVGEIIAIVTRDNDIEEKWVAAPRGMKFSKEEISEKIHFMEQFHQSHICLTQEEYEKQKRNK